MELPSFDFLQIGFVLHKSSKTHSLFLRFSAISALYNKKALFSGVL
jgi:hypothetical protein